MDLQTLPPTNLHTVPYYTPAESSMTSSEALTTTSTEDHAMLSPARSITSSQPSAAPIISNMAREVLITQQNIIPSNITSGPSNSVRVVDLDDGSTQLISWNPNIPDHLFENSIDQQLRKAFGVSDEAWVDLIDMENAITINITKQVLSRVTSALVLSLSSKTTEAAAPMKHSEVFEVCFTEPALGMTIREKNDSIVVNEFKRPRDNPQALLPAEACGKIQIQDVVYKVQGSRTVGRSYTNVIQMLQNPLRPLIIQFFRPFRREGLFAVEFREPSLNMTISTDDSHVIVKDLPMAHANIPGYAESHGVRAGDVIHAIDGNIIRGLEYNRAVALLKRKTRPIIVVFSRSQNTAFLPPTPSGRYAQGISAQVNRFSFASSVAPSPHNANRAAGYGFGAHRKESSASVTSYIGDGERMNVEDMMEFCEYLGMEGTIAVHEVEILKDMVRNARPDVFCAIKRKNRTAIVALVRSPSMRLWVHLLKTVEGIILAGVVATKRRKQYHLVLTDHKRLLLVNKESNMLEDEIMCSQIVTVSSRSATNELLISTYQTQYELIDKFISPVIWVRAILPFTCTQGILKVAGSRRFLGSKKRYFVLQGMKLTGYKRENMVHQIGAKCSSIMLDNAVMEIVDARSYKFAITIPQPQGAAGKQLVLSALSAREFNKWISAFQSLQFQRKAAISSTASPSEANE